VKPTFFSRIDADINASDAAEAVSRGPEWLKSRRDRYWEPHVDREAYKFDYSTLLYLSDWEDDFEGGRLMFMDGTRRQIVAPQVGRVVMFSSGAENVHMVERVTHGRRYVFTVSFSCDGALATKNFLKSALLNIDANRTSP